MIGKIKKVPLREIWEHEARNFTTWLGENIDALNEVMGLKLVVTDIEKTVGPFSSDIVAEDENGVVVIIENQLEKTDHDHLGKMVTYLSNLENAKTAIWISSTPREEHRKAIEWLNEFTPDDVCFYLVKVEAIQINDSDAAPLFTIVAEPTEVAKEIGKEKKELAEKHSSRKEFWTQLLESAKEKTKMLSSLSPSIYHWIGTGSGKQGMSYNLVITNNSVTAELYLDRGKGLSEINKKRFDQLYNKKQEIEALFGNELSWERLDNKRASRICIKFEGYGLKDPENWHEVQEKMINGIINMKRVFDQYIKELE